MKWEKQHLIYFILSSEENSDYDECSSIFEQLEGLPLTINVINVGSGEFRQTSK